MIMTYQGMKWYKQFSLGTFSKKRLAIYGYE